MPGGRRFWRDVSLPAVVAGFVAVLVGYTSSVVIVFQAAAALGASPAVTASWLWALGIGMFLTSTGLSLWYRQPVLTAWSTRARRCWSRPARASAWPRPPVRSSPAAC